MLIPRGLRTLVALAVTALAAGCDGDDTATPAASPPAALATAAATVQLEVAPSPTVTPTPASTPSPSSPPTPAPSLRVPRNLPAGTRTGIPIVDAVIEAFERDDGAAVERLVTFEERPCSQFPLGDLPRPPECWGNEPEGTEVEVVPLLQCGGYYARADELYFEGELHSPGRHFELGGFTNIFIVNIATGEASFVHTAGWSPPSWPLAASADSVAWTENYCNQPGGKTRLFERATGRLIELDRKLWVGFTPGGLLTHGEFGARVLIDPRSLEYVAVIPDPDPNATTGSADDVTWSPDYRYASHGYAGGHGGLCG